jgi:hypothetical protein
MSAPWEVMDGTKTGRLKKGECEGVRKILAYARAFPGISHFLLSQPSPMRLFAIHFAPRTDAFLWGKSGFF